MSIEPSLRNPRYSPWLSLTPSADAPSWPDAVLPWFALRPQNATEARITRHCVCRAGQRGTTERARSAFHRISAFVPVRSPFFGTARWSHMMQRREIESRCECDRGGFSCRIRSVPPPTGVGCSLTPQHMMRSCTRPPNARRDSCCSVFGIGRFPAKRLSADISFQPCCSKFRSSSAAMPKVAPFALRDACPHRGMPLSCGSFDGQQQAGMQLSRLEIAAHTGQCSLIPSLTADQTLKVDRIYAGSFNCEERDDFTLGVHSRAWPARSGLHRSATKLPHLPPSCSKFQRQVQDCFT